VLKVNLTENISVFHSFPDKNIPYIHHHFSTSAEIKTSGNGEAGNLFQIGRYPAVKYALLSRCGATWNIILPELIEELLPEIKVFGLTDPMDQSYAG
jgi:hypothetical protein